MWTFVFGRSGSKRHIGIWKHLSYLPIVAFSGRGPLRSAALHMIERQPNLLYSPVGCLTWCVFTWMLVLIAYMLWSLCEKKLTWVYVAVKHEMVDSNKGCTKKSSHQALGFIFGSSLAKLRPFEFWSLNFVTRFRVSWDAYCNHQCPPWEEQRVLILYLGHPIVLYV
jgi:hypothetical protein